MDEEERYASRPFLRLIECLALDAIDALDDSQRTALERMAPQLGETLGFEGTWQQIVSGQMQWGNGVGIGDAIREVWTRNRKAAEDAGVTLTPEEFAMLFADANSTESDGEEDPT